MVAHSQQSCIANPIRGATTIEALMARFPDGRALRLMALLGWACAHCSARSHEPLALAAKRHGNPVRPVIDCFRALETGFPDTATLAAARRTPRRSPDLAEAWRRSAAFAARTAPAAPPHGSRGRAPR